MLASEQDVKDCKEKGLEKKDLYASVYLMHSWQRVFNPHTL